MLLFISYVLLITACSLVLYYPEADMVVQHFFYNHAKQSFLLAEYSNLVMLSRNALKVLCALYFLVPISYMLYTYKKKKQTNIELYKKPIYVIVNFIAGPLILVHLVIKEIFNRPRPFQVVDFNGAEPFYKVLEISNNACVNCYSFCSGHVFAAAALFSLFYIAESRASKAIALCCTFLLSIFFAFLRIAEGYHWLSDTVFSMFIAFLLSHLLYKLIVKRNFCK